MEKMLVFAAGSYFLRTFFSLPKRVVLMDAIVVICVTYGVLVKTVVFNKLKSKKKNFKNVHITEIM